MWFTENPWPPMVAAGVAALIFFGMWNGNRRNLHLILSVLCLVACGAFYLIERAIVTDGERLQSAVAKLCEDFRLKDPNFANAFSVNAPGLKTMALTAMAMVQIKDDLRLTDFQTTFTNEGSRGTVHFRANASLNVLLHGDVGRQPFRAKIVYQREGGEWKIVDIQRLNPLNGKPMETLQQSAG